MSTAQTLALGAVAGFTIFLGLPLGRFKTPTGDCRQAFQRSPAASCSSSCGTSFRTASRPSRRRSRKPSTGVARGASSSATRPARRRPHRRSHEPRLLRPLDEAAAQLDARWTGCSGHRRVRLAALDRPPLHRAPAGASHRGRHRPPQLRRGPGHRPGGSGGRDQLSRSRSSSASACTTRPRDSASSAPCRERASGRAGASSVFSA